MAGWSKARCWGLRASIACGAALSGGCQDGYPVAATLCDEWCDQTRRLNCETYDPAACVAGCEQAGLGRDACSGLTERTVQCLRETPDERLDCENPLGPMLGAALAQCQLDQYAAVSCGATQSQGGSPATQ